MSLVVSGIFGYLVATVQNPTVPNFTIAEGMEYRTRNSASFLIGRAIYVSNQTYGPTGSFMNNSLVMMRDRQYAINATASKQIVIENWFDDFGLSLNFTSSGTTTVFVNTKTLGVPLAHNEFVYGGGSLTYERILGVDSLFKFVCTSGSGLNYTWDNNLIPANVYCEARVHWENNGWSLRLMTPVLDTTTPNPWSRRADVTSATFQVTIWSNDNFVNVRNVQTFLGFKTDHQANVRWRNGVFDLPSPAGLSFVSGSGLLGSGDYRTVVFTVTFPSGWGTAYPDSDSFESVRVRITADVADNGPGADSSDEQPRVYESPAFPFDFTLQASPTTVSIVWPGRNTGASSMIVNILSGPRSTYISFSCSGLPSGASCGFTSPAPPLSRGKVSVLTVTIPSSLASAVSPGSYPFTVTGTNGTLSRSVGMTLDVAWAPSTQAEKVLFGDDFLGPGSMADSGWVYASTYSDVVAKASTKSGYMILRQTGTTRATEVYVGNPAYVEDYSVITHIKRKLTVSLLPFTAAGSSTGALKIGFAPMIASGDSEEMLPPAIPNFLSPFPNFDKFDNCVYGGNTGDNRAMEYARIYNDGSVALITCGDGGVRQTSGLPAITVSLYTVVTMTYQAVGPGAVSRQNNVTLRVYQRDVSGNIVYDQHVSLLSDSSAGNVDPLGKRNYVFLALQGYGAADAVSQIDFVQLQNFGSPVDLRLPTTTPFPNSGQGGILGGLAYFVNLIGFGSPLLGAILLYLFTMMGLCLPIAVLSKHVFPTAVIGILVTAIFAYAGLIPIWPVVLILVGASVVMVLVMRKVIGGGGGGVGGEGDSGGGGGI